MVIYTFPVGSEYLASSLTRTYYGLDVIIICLVKTSGGSISSLHLPAFHIPFGVLILVAELALKIADEGYGAPSDRPHATAQSGCRVTPLE